MTAVEKHLSNYFGTLNSITRKIHQDKENFIRSYEGNWDVLNEDEQDAVLENYLIDSSVRRKYENVVREDAPPMFPKLVISSGEKIVVDFEHEDGWTWRDEHSGPFSWMTKSQQDLTLDDLDALDEPTSKQKTRGKSRSPDRENGSRRVRDPPFINQDKGTNAEAANTADEIFQKFGIAFSFGKDQDQVDVGEADSMLKEVLSPIEESKLLHGQQEYENEQFVLDEEEDYGTDQVSTTHNSSPKDESFSEAYMSSDMNSISKRTSTASISSTSSRSKKKDKNKHSRSRTLSNPSEAEISLIDSDQEDASRTDHGQVSPVYIEDPGESSTDPGSSVMSSSRYSYTDTLVVADSPSVLGSDNLYTESASSFASTVISEQPIGTVNIADISLNSSDNVQDDHWNANLINENDDNAGTVKSGFDFLDNW